MLCRCGLAFAHPARSAALVGFTAALLVGCAGPTPTYPGPRKAPSEVAIVSGDVKVKIIKIDGTKVNGGAFEVLPGEHHVDVKITFLGEEISSYHKGKRKTCYADAKFIADPGQKYRAMRSSKRGKGGYLSTQKYDAWLQNITTGERLDDAMSEMNCGV
ncbi:MAG: hypothetical protein JRH16_02250 [Deltaproteobacteria bacterium]|nr:hypothetical protein [Deltaproteobacteria bacterium]MBW2360554.1 hypothetical protein [Deltaproteobacteria bacterium]